MSTVFRASWLLPITSAPIPDGWVLVDEGRVVEVGDGAAPRGHREVHLGPRAILPGLVNAHTHLELSWMRARVAPASRMPDWIRALMALRRDVHRDDPFAMAAAVGEIRRAGTSLVGDITNTLASIHALGAGPVGGWLFYEMLGFNHPDPVGRLREKVDQVRAAARARVRTSIVPHAPYSVAPAMLRAIATLASEERWRTSIHLGESPDEVEFLATGQGAFRDLLESVGAWTDSWHPPGIGPLAYIESCGLLSERTLIVHAVHLTDEELRRVAEAGATIVTCPRSNRWVGAGDPPIARFYRSGARVAIGTDSLASCPDLNLFGELARIREIAPEIAARTLLHSATQAGAEALGFEDVHGALERGRRADLIAVDIPAGSVDVEEYLCSGIRPDAISWLEAGGWRLEARG
jgi:cytosine/adenosine deaminase-related metal-dependent hydrolase